MTKPGTGYCACNSRRKAWKNANTGCSSRTAAGWRLSSTRLRQNIPSLTVTKRNKNILLIANVWGRAKSPTYGSPSPRHGASRERPRCLGRRNPAHAESNTRRTPPVTSKNFRKLFKTRMHQAPTGLQPPTSLRSMKRSLLCRRIQSKHRRRHRTRARAPSPVHGNSRKRSKPSRTRRVKALFAEHRYPPEPPRQSPRNGPQSLHAGSCGLPARMIRTLREMWTKI